MSIGIGSLILCAVIGLAVGVYTKRTTSWSGKVATWTESVRAGAIVTVALATVVAVVWFFVAVPISTYNRNTCERVAEGYRLDYDWSIRNGCRLELPSGQLVPSGHIRITSDGEIVVGEDI